MTILEELKLKALEELTGNILPFWDNIMPDRKHGGFYGRADGYNNIIPDAPKGGIMHARILWTYAAVYNKTGDPFYLKAASAVADYILDHFFDHQQGGTWWSLTAKGEPLDRKKMIYSQSYFIYALSECFRATRKRKYLDGAINLFHLVEKHGHDKVNGGYTEAFDHEWEALDDRRLSDKDINEKKSMNTHLHLIEAYANLFSLWPDESLGRRLTDLVNIFTGRIIDPHSSHLNLFFDESWNVRSDIISYGHDIEASWLLYEAGRALGDSKLTKSLEPVSLGLLKAALEGLRDDGSLVYEKNTGKGHTDTDRHWWVQAEAVTGLFNAFMMTGDHKLLGMAQRCFEYITINLVDDGKGEWYWSVREDGTVNREDDKAGFWKCPYHNSRMCLELISRI